MPKCFRKRGVPACRGGAFFVKQRFQSSNKKPRNISYFVLCQALGFRQSIYHTSWNLSKASILYCLRQWPELQSPKKWSISSRLSPWNYYLPHVHLILSEMYFCNINVVKMESGSKASDQNSSGVTTKTLEKRCFCCQCEKALRHPCICPFSVQLLLGPHVYHTNWKG